MRRSLFVCTFVLLMLSLFAACHQTSSAEKLEALVDEAIENIGTYNNVQWQDNFREYQSLCTLLEIERDSYSAEEWAAIEAVEARYDNATRAIFTRIGLGLDAYATDEEMLEAMGFTLGEWFDE